MDPLGLGDIVTIGCILLNCEDYFKPDDDHHHSKQMVVQPEAQTPRRSDGGVLYPGVGYSSTSPNEALQDAYANITSMLMLETGAEIRYLNNFLLQEKNAQTTSDYTSETRLDTSNFLSGGEVMYSETQAIEGGYQAKVGFFLDAAAIEDLKEWSNMARERHYAELSRIWLYGESFVTVSDHGSYSNAMRVAKLMALRDLSENASTLVEQDVLFNHNVLAKDSLKLTTRSVLSDIDFVSAEERDGVLHYKLKSLNPLNPR